MYVVYTVINKHHYKNKPLPSDLIFVGRGSKWGNPYSHLDSTLAEFKVATREEAIEKYREYLLSNAALLNALPELKNKNLLCYCKPKACHADLLFELANKE